MNLYFGEVQPAHGYISQGALDWNKKLDTGLIKPDVARAIGKSVLAGF